MGLLHAVHPPERVLDAKLNYARELLDSVAPSSLRSVKRQASTDLFRTIGESNDEAVRLIHEMIGSEDYRRGVEALTEKRSPGFAARYRVPGGAHPG